MKSFSQIFGKTRGSVLSLVFCVFFIPVAVDAAPRGQPYQDPNAAVIREMRNSLDDLRHEVRNHEVEISIIDEKLKNYDAIVESVRDQFTDFSQMQKEQLKGSSAQLEAKIQSLETTSQSLLGDLRQFKAYSSETTSVLNQYREKINELERIIDQQGQNIGHLQAAMQSLMEALQGKPVEKVRSVAMNNSSPVKSSSGITYRVKAGDSLEKIARAHQVSIQSLKEANGLTTDRIIVGKNLVIPEK
jgi:LysM repeat protein